MTREEAVYQINQLAVLSTDKEIPKITEALDMAIEALQREDNLLKSLETNEPIYDMVDVVRCKDCKHKVVTKDGEYNPEDIVCDYWATDGLYEIDYCSYGERKGGDDE